jgi:flagellar assembly protein FliH
MSNRVIPKEESADYKKWDMNSFDKGKAAAPNKPTEEAPVKLPTASELEGMQQRARQEGYETGVHIVRQEVAQLSALAKSFSESVASLENEVAEKLLSLSINIARQILREALVVKPEFILPVVKEAISSLAESRQHNVLRLNPSDVEIVTKHMGDELSVDGWKIVSDDKIEAGGCKIESTNGEVNATLETRWKRIISNLGANDEWIE